MIELSRRMPRDANGLSKIRGLEPGQIRREGDKLLELIAKGTDLPREQWPTDKGRAKPLNASQEAMVDLLSAGLRLIAEQHQLTPLAIASRKELEKLARGESDCVLHEGWRHSLAGETLSALLRGEHQLNVRNGELKFVADTD